MFTGIGTVVNAAAILAGTAAGVLIRGGIPERLKKTIFDAVGLSVMFIGIAGAMAGMLKAGEGGLGTANSMMLVLSMLLGGVTGELLRLEERLEGLGEVLKKRFIRGEGSGSRFVEGFVSASVIFVVGSMAIVGSLQDGLMHDPSVLFTKAILDGVISVVLAASLGVGVAFSALAILVYQGGITLFARLIAPYLTETLIGNMSFVGSVLIFCIGVNFLWPKKIRTGNLLPAMFWPILLGLVLK